MGNASSWVSAVAQILTFLAVIVGWIVLTRQNRKQAIFSERFKYQMTSRKSFIDFALFIEKHGNDAFKEPFKTDLLNLFDNVLKNFRLYEDDSKIELLNQLSASLNGGKLETFKDNLQKSYDLMRKEIKNQLEI